MRVPGPIGSIRKQSSPACVEAERHRPRQDTARRLEHEELARDPGLERSGVEPQERVRADRLDAGDPSSALPLARAWAAHAPVPIRSCSESAVSARAFAIACTAAAAPEIVVMQGTRAASAASRMR